MPKNVMLKQISSVKLFLSKFNYFNIQNFKTQSESYMLKTEFWVQQFIV